MNELELRLQARLEGDKRDAEQALGRWKNILEESPMRAADCVAFMQLAVARSDMAEQLLNSLAFYTGESDREAEAGRGYVDVVEVMRQDAIDHLVYRSENARNQHADAMASAHTQVAAEYVKFFRRYK
jgi:hypothetical protein